MSLPQLKDMLDAGVHFGHQTLRWNPKMKKFILTERNGIHIIDLEKTGQCLEKALVAVQQIVSKKQHILFVGTKKSVKHCVEDEAKRCGMPYVTNRWLGGMLTNFTTVRQSIKTLEDIEKMEEEGLTKALKKKEVIAQNKKKQKLEDVLGGIRKMPHLPSLIFAVDTKTEHIAVKEAKRLRIPILAIVDTNSNPDEIDFPIPANDDAIKSVQLIAKTIGDQIIEITGKNTEIQAPKETAKPEETAAPSNDTAKEEKTDAKPESEAPAPKS